MSDSEEENSGSEGEEEEDEEEDEEEEEEEDGMTPEQKAQAVEDDFEIIQDVFRYLDQTVERISQLVAEGDAQAVRSRHQQDSSPKQQQKQRRNDGGPPVSWEHYESLNDADRATLLERALTALATDDAQGAPTQPANQHPYYSYQR